MKKRVLILVAALTMLCLTACGAFTCDFCGEEKSGKSHEVDVFGTELIVCSDCKEEISRQLAELEEEETVKGNENKGSSSSKPTSNDDKKDEQNENDSKNEQTAAEPKLYDRLSAWDDFYDEYGSYFTAIQIEDMFFYPGMTGSEFNAVIAASEDKQLVPIPDGKIVKKDNIRRPISGGRKLNYEYCEVPQFVTVYRNDTPWMDAFVLNYSEDMLPFNECIVTMVKPRIVAKEYSRFFDGNYSMEDMKKIKYSDKEAFREILSKCDYSLEELWGIYWSIESIDRYISTSVSDTNYGIKQRVQFGISLDFDTGYVGDFFYQFNGAWGSKEDERLEYSKPHIYLYRDEPIFSFDDLTVDNLSAVIEAAYHEAGTSSYEVAPMYISFGNAEKEEALSSNVLHVVVKKTPDSYYLEEHYSLVVFFDPWIIKDNNQVYYENASIWEYTSLDELLTTHNLLGTPEDNPQITEYLPKHLADELAENMGFILDERCIAQ